MANVAVFDHEVGAATGGKAGPLRRLLARMIQARTQEARRRVGHALSGLAGDRLSELGVSGEEIAHWNSRAGY